MKTVLSGAVAALALLACAPSFAAEAPGAPAVATATPRSLELARRYMVAIHMEQTMTSMMSNMAPSLIDMQLKAHPELAEGMTPELRQALVEVMSEVVTEKLPEVESQMVRITAETYTEQELTDLVAFYEGPTGQALIRKAPLLMKHMPEIMATMGPPDSDEIQRRLCKKLGCNVQPPKANKS